MTKQERVIVSAYTGFLMCDFGDMHEYIEKIMGRPVWTHELAMKPIMDEIKQKSKHDFLALPQNPELKTRCAFIRDDNGKAVVMFINAEWAARVNYCYLSKEDY